MNHVLRRGTAGALALALGVALAGCGNDSSSGSRNSSSVVKIGILESLSGDLNALGKPYAAGAELAIKDINAAGGFTVDGKKYTLKAVVKDTRSTGPATVAGMNELAAPGGAKVVFGPLSTPLALQAAEIAVPAKVIELSAAGGWAVSGLLSDPKKPYLFNTAQSQVATAETLGQGLKSAGYRTVAMINTDDSTTNANLPAVVEGFKKAGIEVVADIRYPADSPDLSSYVAKAARTKPDVILHATQSARTIEVLRLADELGASKALAAWVFGPKALSDANLKLPVYSANTSPSMDYPSSDRIAALAERMKAFKGDLGATKDLSFQTYDYVYMVVSAMEKVGSVTDTDAIAKELAAMKYDGVVGRICFGDGANTRVPVYPSFLSSVVGGEAKVTPRERECQVPGGEPIAYKGP